MVHGFDSIATKVIFQKEQSQGFCVGGKGWGFTVCFQFWCIISTLCCGNKMGGKTSIKIIWVLKLNKILFIAFPYFSNCLQRCLILWKVCML